MATEGGLRFLTGVKASADLSAKQFRFVKISGDGTVDVTSGITDKVCGVLQDAPTSGQAAMVANGGKSKVLAGGTITAGALVGTKNDGTAVAIVAGTDTTQYVCGQCVKGGASGEIIEVDLDNKAGRAA